MSRTSTGIIAPIRFVTVQNFRAVRDLTIELAPDVTVFFGVNAAGKTTLLDALAIGLGAIGSRVPKAAGRDFAKSGDIRVPWTDHPGSGERRGVESPYARITITCANGLRWDVSKYRSAQDRPNVPAPIGAKALHEVLDPLVLAALEEGSGQGPSQGIIPLVGAYGTERAVVDVPLRERDFRREFYRLGAFDQSLLANTRFKSVFEWFRVTEDEERRERERRKDFNYGHPPLEWVRRAVARAGLRCKNPRIATKPIRMLVDFEHQDGALEPLDISSLSDGYRTHFSLVVDVARRMVQLNPSDDLSSPDRGTNSEAVILIDEIDLHLDPTWQATVVKGLRDAFPHAQLVLTTHSEQVIGSVPASSVRKLVAGDGEVLVENVPFAQGATGERILIELMGAKERVAGPTTDKLTTYMDLVNRGEGERNNAKALRAELDLALPGDERLHQADLEMQKRALLGQIKGGDSMKHVRALSAEPPLLAKYRSDHPAEERRPANEASATWEGFKSNQVAYKQLLDELARAQQGLCIYCEQLLVDKIGKLVPNDYQVEHVHAKSGAAGRVLDWTNLALACAGATYGYHQEPSRKYNGVDNTSCGQRKADDDLPAGCDPRKLPLTPALLPVGLDGKLSVSTQNCQGQGVSVKDLENAIALLNLNCERLRKARQDRWDNINSWVVPLLAELLAATHLSATQRQQLLDLVIAGRLQPNDSGYLRAFWTTERCALGADAETWTATNQCLFI